MNVFKKFDSLQDQDEIPFFMRYSPGFAAPIWFANVKTKQGFKDKYMNSRGLYLLFLIWCTIENIAFIAVQIALIFLLVKVVSTIGGNSIYIIMMFVPFVILIACIGYVAYHRLPMYLYALRNFSKNK